VPQIVVKLVLNLFLGENTVLAERDRSALNIYKSGTKIHKIITNIDFISCLHALEIYRLYMLHPGF